MSKRILIADDSVTIQKAFAMTFAAEDVTLLAARSPDEGLSLARQSQPDLVIADVSMGGRNGYDFCRALKSDAALAHVPVYLLGSVHNPVDPGGLRGCAADGELTKPFDSTAMIGQVREALAKGSVAAAAAPPITEGIPESAVDADSATLEVPPDLLPDLVPDIADDYGEIAIEASGPNDGFEAAAVAGPTPLPEKDERHPQREQHQREQRDRDEEVATPPPVVRSPSLAPRQVPAAVVAVAAAASPAGHAGAPAAPLQAAPFPAQPTAPQVPSHAAGWHPPAAHPAGASPGGGMRPSLIPGLRPGIVPAASARAFAPGRPSGAASSPPPTASAFSAASHSPSQAPPSSAGAVGGGGVGTLGPGATHVGRGGAPPVPMVTPASARTLVGMPAVSAQAPVRPANQPIGIRPGALAAPGFPPSSLGGQLPGSAVAQAQAQVQAHVQASVHARGNAAPAAPAVAAATVSAPGSLFPLAPAPPSGAGAGVVAALSSGAASVLGSKVDQKLGAIAARGPEYEAIAKLSREIIEKIVWEVVPELAEAIIREELSKRGRI